MNNVIHLKKPKLVLQNLYHSYDQIIYRLKTSTKNLTVINLVFTIVSKAWKTKGAKYVQVLQIEDNSFFYNLKVSPIFVNDFSRKY